MFPYNGPTSIPIVLIDHFRIYYAKPQTQVVSLWMFFYCCLLIAGCCELFPEATTALAICGISITWSTRNSLFAMVFSQCQFSFNRNNHHIITEEVSRASLKGSEINNETCLQMG